MRCFRAHSSKGIDYSRCFRQDEITCAVIIYPMPGGLFQDITVDWYTSMPQAERHAADWRRHGYEVEVVCTETVDSPATVR